MNETPKNRKAVVIEEKLTIVSIKLNNSSLLSFETRVSSKGVKKTNRQ